MTIYIATQSALREAFWDDHQQFRRVHADGQQNKYPADVRMAWVDFIDRMQKNGAISEKLADKAIL